MKVLETDFYIEEFVPKEVYQKFGDASIWFVNPNIILFTQWLKEHRSSSIIINDWKWGGKYNYSGFRPKSCNIGAEFSQHRLGNALDVKVPGYKPSIIRDLIRTNFTSLNEKFKLSTIEKGTLTWTHIDFRYTGLTKLFEV